MEILFTNKTKYTKQAYKKYLEFHQKKYGINYTFTTIVIILLLSFCIINNFQYSNYFTAIVFMIALILFCFYRYILPYKKVTKELETKKFKQEETFTFNFYEKLFTIQNKDSKVKISYIKLYKVFQTEEYFYLYINKNNAYTLNKTTFTKGNPSEFFNFMKKKIWYKL